MRIGPLLLLGNILLVVTNARACLNDIDSDTLANEAKGLPDVINIAAGRFERNPPLYYEMRIERVEKELRSDPSRLPLYDDISVALDRLARDQEAIAWQEKKRALLTQFKSTDPAIHEQLYRYYANCGTFWAHHWLRAGANRKQLDEMRRARDYIATAIKLKPNAHFGREKYQLLAMEWVLHPSQMSFARYLGVHIQKNPEAYNDVVTGLSGLIVLGNAWESVDIFRALAAHLPPRKSTVNYFVLQRCIELVHDGKKSLQPDATEAGLTTADGLIGVDIPADNIKKVEKLYQRQRRAADEWQSNRTNFMMVRLKAGRHPDTDTHFWDGYHELPAPSLETEWYDDENFVLTLEGIGAIAAVIIAELFYLRRRRLQRKVLAAP